MIRVTWTGWGRHDPGIALAAPPDLLAETKSVSHCLPQGLSLLEVKDQLLLMYLMDLSHLILDKASGGSLQGHPAVLRLVEIRTV